MGEQVALSECPIGLFRADDGELCVKTEYGVDYGPVTAYIITTGEFFWGGAKTKLEQRGVLVTPLPLATICANAKLHEAARTLVKNARFKPGASKHSFQVSDVALRSLDAALSKASGTAVNHPNSRAEPSPIASPKGT